MSEANNPSEAEAPEQELAPEAATDGAEIETTDTGSADTSDEEGSGEEGQEPDEEFEDFELDGQKYQITKSLKAHLKTLEEAGLRQDDYTRKTQTLAEERKALEAAKQADEQARAQQREVMTKLREEIVKVGHLESQLAAYKDVDWRGAQAQIAQIADPTAKAQAVAEYNLAWSNFTALEREVQQAQQDLSRKEQDLVAAQTQAVQAAVTQTLQAIQKDDPTFNVEKAQAAVKHAMDNFGLTDAEARQLSDGRIWKLMLSDKAKTDRISELEAENKRLKGQRAAQDANKAAQQARPAVRVKGAAPANSNPRDDDPIDVWMKKERARVERKAARG